MTDFVKYPKLHGILVNHKSVRSGVSSAWYGHVPFARWLVEAAQPSILVELGTHNGVSYTAFCDSIASIKQSAKCYAVDTWQDEDRAGWSGEDVYRDLSIFHDARFGSFSRLVRSTCAEALEGFGDHSIDILHINRRNSYDDVKTDYYRYRPKLSGRAIVLVHGINARGRDSGVWKFWDELKLNHPHFEFLHCRGLGVLCVGSEVPPIVRTLVDAPINDAVDIRTLFAHVGHLCALESDAKKESDLEADLSSAHAEIEAQATRSDLLRRQLSEALTAKNQLEREKTELASVNAQVTAHERGMKGEVERLKRLAASQERSSYWLRSEVDKLRHQYEKHEHDAKFNQSQLRELSAAAELRLAELSTTTARLQSIEGSTTWLLTAPFRRLAGALPSSIRRHGRRCAKLAYWLVTPWKTHQRLEFLRQRKIRSSMPVATLFDPPHKNSVPVRNRFSLEHLTPADRKADWPAIDWYDDVNPEVSIVVLNWNRSDMTLRCLEYIWQHTHGATYEVIIVDNGSAPDDIERLARLKGPARLLPLGVNRYFGEANNIGVESAHGEFVCLLNNDAFVHDGWLLPLLQVLRTDQTVGAVGPRLLYPGGALQEAGALVQPDGAAVQLGKGDDANRSAYERDRRVDYVSAACCLLKRATFHDVLGFDLMYDPAYYEDADLCLKVRLAGLSTRYCASSTVTHIENATSVGTKNNLGLGSVVEINRAKFVARWGAYLAGDKSAAPALIPDKQGTVSFVHPERAVAVYTPYNLTPGGGERVLLTIVEAFRGHPVSVTLITPYPFSRIRILTMGRELGIKLDHLEFATLEKGVDLKLDHLFIIGNEITPPIRGFAARNTYICQFPFPIQDPAYVARTRANWFAIDDIVCYSEFVRTEIEKAAKANNLPSKPIITLAAPVSLIKPAGEKNRSRILHVGRFFAGGHSKRQDILIETAKRFIDQGVDLNVHFAGSLHPEPEHRAYYADLAERASGYPIHFHVNCSPEQLEQLYSSAGIYWHATGYGVDPEHHPERMEHFGISVIEAMSAGCIPVVFGAGGPKEIVRDSETGFHFRTEDEIFDRTQEILNYSDADYLEMAERARADAYQYSSENFRRAVRSLSQQSE